MVINIEKKQFIDLITFLFSFLFCMFDCPWCLLYFN